MSFRLFKKEKQERRILRQIERSGDRLQAEYHRATPECPHPERWRMFDSMTAEAEVLEFLRTLVTTIKPELVVETGTFSGISTLWIAEGLKANGRGRVISCEYDRDIYLNAKARIDASGLADWIELRNASSLEMEVEGTIDLHGTVGISLLGAAFAFLAGLVALKWLSNWLENGRWYLFGFYCLAASAVVWVLHTQGY